MMVIPIIIAIIFIVLASLHFYWAFFGIKNPELVLPIESEAENAKLPSAIMTSVVGLGLLFFGLVFLNRMIGFLNFNWLRHVQMAIGIIFLIRAIGDFKHVGFFKSIKNTSFSRMDTKYYAPLCLLLAILIAITVFAG